MRAQLLRLLFLALVLAGSGCQWAKRVTWDLSARENEPRSPQDFNIEQQSATDYRDIQEQRAKLEADYRAANPGARPPGR